MDYHISSASIGVINASIQAIVDTRKSIKYSNPVIYNKLGEITDNLTNALSDVEVIKN